MNVNNEHWNSDFGFTGPYTTVHHKCFQMVELMMMSFKRTVYGLNPYAVPYRPVMSNDVTEVREELKETKEESEWRSDHQRRKRSNVEDSLRNVIQSCRNRHRDLYEEDVDSEEDDDCHVNFNDIETKENDSNKEELTEHEHEVEFFNVLIDNCMCDGSHDVCLHSLTQEEDKIQKEKANKEVNSGKNKFRAMKNAKEEEAMEVTRQMDEHACRNVHNICWNSLSREEEKISWKNTQVRKEPKISIEARNHLNNMKLCRGRMRIYGFQNQRRFDG